MFCYLLTYCASVRLNTD